MLNKQGISLISLLVSVAVLLALSVAVFIWIDPISKIGQAKDAARQHDVQLIVRAIADYSRDKNGVLPFFGIVSTAKKVLCSGAGSLTCDGDTEDCLYIDDDDFDSFLAQLPVDPDKTDQSDTGYFVKKSDANQLVVGACDTYDSEAIVSTSTIDVKCEVYSNGYCWIDGDTGDQSCDESCAAHNMECIDQAGYSADGSCTFIELFGHDCSAYCFVNNGSHPPYWYTAASVCSDETTVYDCYQHNTDFVPICACQ